MKNTVTANLAGGLGNHFYQIACAIAYAKKFNIDFYIPDTYCAHNNQRFKVKNTVEKPAHVMMYHEPKHDLIWPFYYEIPFMQNPVFVGFWQSFKFFDWCRQDILDYFELPYNPIKGIVSLHVRRGDAVPQTGSFPMAPIEYYKKCMFYFNALGYNKFKVFSDDIAWCKNEFISQNYSGAEFEFVNSGNDLQDLIELSNCEHHITARSTFSFVGAWLCQNPDKIVLCPPWPFFKSCNKDMIPDYYTVIECEINSPESWTSVRL